MANNERKRRKTKNKTGISRIDGIPYHEAWCSYTCLKCKSRNYERIGHETISPRSAFENCKWTCLRCGYEHSKSSNLPFEDWPIEAVDALDIPAERFWMAFFRSATENLVAYWKQCNTCGRILPNADFSRHAQWGPLEKQMECRACKAVINAYLNPKRTTEQLRESAMRRRIAELLVKGDDEKLDVTALFKRFEGKCFKTGKPLNIDDGSSWQIDHTLPSKYFYPLSVRNATLLSVEANQNKSDKWPSEYYSNQELLELSRITGASLELLSSREPVINKDIDVNACVDRFLRVRDASDLKKRITGLKDLLEKYGLSDELSEENRKMLGL